MAGVGMATMPTTIHPSNLDSSSSPLSITSMLQKLNFSSAATTTAPSPKLEFLFEDDSTTATAGPSWNTRLCYGTGSAFLIGLGAGGLWGAIEGLTRAEARNMSARIRINLLLNSITSRGPFVGNTAGIVALCYNVLAGAFMKLQQIRSGKE